MRTAALVVAGSVLLSRILGLFREALLAALLGSSAETDLYFQAFLLPDILNYLVAGAFLTITLVPILAKHIERGDDVAADRAFTSVFRFVAWAVVGLTALMWIFAPQLVQLVFPESTDPERLVDMTRLVLPAQVFLVLGALFMAVQYTKKRFVIPAAAPLVYNLGIIGGGLVGLAVGDPEPEFFLVGAVVGAFIGNFALQWWGALRTGLQFRRPEKGDSAIGEYLTLAVPLMVGQSIAVLDEQFVRIFAQDETAATTYLTFARRTTMVPIGVIAQAAGIAAFPYLASLHARGAGAELVETTGRAARKTLFVAGLAAAGLIVLAKPVVNLIYGYGEFTAEDAEIVAGLVAIYAFTIPAWGMHQLLVRHFYAKRKMWTPVVIGTIFTAVAIPTWLILGDAFGVEGFALASTLVITAYALGMLIAWGFDSGQQAVRDLAPAFFRALVAAGFAALVGIPLVNAMVGPDELGNLEWLGIAAVGGMTSLAAYLGASWALRSREMTEVLSRS